MRFGSQRLLLAWSLVVGCGTLESSAPTDAGDDGGAADGGRTDGDVLADADAGDGAPGDGADAGHDRGCSPDLDGGVTEPLTDLGVLDSVRFTHDGAIAYVAQRDPDIDAADEDIFQGPWPKPAAALYAGVVRSPARDLSPAPIADPLQLYFERNLQIWSGQRSDPDQNFQTVAPIPIDAGSGARQPYAMQDGASFYFTRSEGAASSIFRAVAQGGTWTIAPVPGLDETGTEGDPVVSEDELAIYFSRTSSGTSHVFGATRASPTDAFANVHAIGVLATTANDRPSWISPDRCTLVFTSDRSGSWQAYKLTLTP